MNDIIRHIEYLLVTDDCVVIPGFGAILAHTVAAKFDVSKEFAVPPRRIYTFDPALNHNDGKLTASVARACNISLDEASTLVGNLSSSLVENLRSGKVVALGRIGSLKSTGGSISFVPSSESASFSADTMWLCGFNLRNLSDLVKERRTLEEIRRRRHGKGRILRYAATAGRVAASLALLIAVGLLVSTPITVDNAQYASMGIENFKPTEPKHDSNRLMRRPGELSSSLVLVLDRSLDAAEVVDTAAHNEYVRSRAVKNVQALEHERISSSLRLDKNDRYFIVVASLTTQSDAETFILKSKNKNLAILEKDGRYRVYAATGETMQQAKVAAEQLSGQYSDAWICRK